MLSKKYFQQLKIGEKGCQERFQLIERRRKKGKLKILHVTKIFNLIFPPLW
jgi:hypothetical protein